MTTKTDDIKLPELPLPNAFDPGRYGIIFSPEQMKAYGQECARAAVEADRQGNDTMLAHEWIRPALNLPDDAPYRFDYYAQKIGELMTDRQGWMPSDELRGMADTAYGQYIQQMRSRECLGWEQKVKTGQFGEAELKAHTRAGELLGRHRAFSECADILSRYGSSQPAALSGVRSPDGYAYRYADGIRFTDGREINGCRPIEGIPYWFGTTPPVESKLATPVAQEPVSVTERWQDGDDSNMVSRVETAAPVAAQLHVTDEMVTRFLGWHLPQDFAPDAGISFTPSPDPHSWPTGTNLLTDPQARAMLEYVFTGVQK